MLYCEKCNSLTGGEDCPVCGGALRQPEINDYILFAVRCYPYNLHLLTLGRNIGAHGRSGWTMLYARGNGWHRPVDNRKTT